MSESIQQIIGILSEISEDECISNGVREKIFKSIETMNLELDNSVKANKVLDLLENLLESSAVDTQVRTQLWSVTSLLETL